MNEELVKRLRRYTMGCVAYKLDSDFAAAVQEAADVIEKMGELEHGLNWLIESEEKETVRENGVMG